MIKLSISKSSIEELNREIALKVEAIGYMTQPAFLEEVSRAAFVVIGEKFMFAVDRYSAMNRKRMHHIYEWNKVGKPTARLFVLNRVNLMGGSFITQVGFLPSREPVPIQPELLLKGRSGRSVQNRNIFRDKARMMEENVQVSYVTKKVQVFSDGFEPSFVAPGTRITINNPGGRFVKNSLAEFMAAWYKKNSQTVMDFSGLYEKIATEASIILSKNKTGIPDVKRVTSQIVNAIVAGREIIK